MSNLIWIVLGCVIGAMLSAIVARVAVRRAEARARVFSKRARSAERLAEIGSMTSGLAHEIKNPLSTIGLNAQLLGEAIADLQIDEQEKGRMGRRVGALRGETDRLRGILEDFLEYAGELRLDLRPTELNDLIEQLGDFFHVQAQSSGVQIRLDPSPLPVTLEIDSNHIKQAVLNLMINAVNSMKDSSESGKELILRVSTDPSGDASIHVIDTGPGISQEDQERIFHPYFTTRASGTGLGLPTARRIVEAHGGSLELHSELGKGSDFSIVLHAQPMPEN
tara:strand:+ start:93462 stop:94298 length:837 start_codon:yes stop_codon:yes gene_type:complete